MTTVLLAFGAWLLLDVVLVGGYLLWRRHALRRRAAAAASRPALRLVAEDGRNAPPAPAHEDRPAAAAPAGAPLDLDRVG